MNRAWLGAMVVGVAALGAISLGAACGGSTGSTGGGGQGGSPLICPQEAVPCCTPSNPDPCCMECGTTSGSTSTSTSTGTGGGTPAVCGGKMGIPCAADELCNYPDDSCGAFDSTGVCEKRPVGCPDIYQPTCACDGMVYGTACDAQAAGQDENLGGGCVAPTGMFACGARFCSLDAEYCEQSIAGVPGMADTYSCLPIPSGCSSPTCGCLVNVACGMTCTTTADGGLMVSCAGV